MTCDVYVAPIERLLIETTVERLIVGAREKIDLSAQVSRMRYGVTRITCSHLSSGAS